MSHEDPATADVLQGTHDIVILKVLVIEKQEWNRTVTIMQTRLSESQ